jgi:hypothetical protein
VHHESPLGREPLASAMRVGVQYVLAVSRLRAVLLRIALFFLHSTALLALLPLVARGLPGGEAGTFTVLLASMGVGAIIAALLMPRIRAWLPLQPLVLVGTACRRGHAGVRLRAQHLAGGAGHDLLRRLAWITVANSLTVAAQMALPDWVRARGMSIYQMALMGAPRSAPRCGARSPPGPASTTSAGDRGGHQRVVMFIAQRTWWPTAAPRRT